MSGRDPEGRFTAREREVLGVICFGHFLSHFYILALPPLFLLWQRGFHASYAELGLTVAAMSAVTAILQTPVGYLVDRHGPRRFLVGGVALMAAGIALMGFAHQLWQVLALAALSGVGNAVIHPVDYAVLTSAIAPRRIGRAFGLHIFAGNLGFAAGPPVVAALAGGIGWRAGLLLAGSLGVGLALVLLRASRILPAAVHLAGPHAAGAVPGLSGRALLLSAPILMFLAFYTVTTMAAAGLQAWMVTVLHQAHGMALDLAASALTLFTLGVAAGVLAGGWIADHTPNRGRATAALLVAAAGVILFLGLAPLPRPAIFALLLLAGLLLGASRTPRDVLVKEAAPPGQMGKVFGFVSGGLPLGRALTPAPFGLLIDAGRPTLVFVLAAALLVGSLALLGATALFAARPRPALAAE